MSLARCHPGLARAFGLVLMACSWSSWADDNRALREQQAVMASKAFLDAHPDLKHRTEGFLRLEEGRTEDARKSFLEAALFADKPSQAVLAEMAWKGIGQPTDRPRAYAWADISAERGYPLMLVKREKFWKELTEAERARALEIGPAVYDEFGDAVAKERLARELRFAKRQTTGSRVGSVGALTIVIPTPGGSEVVDGTAFYDEKFWNIDQYVQWQDNDWKQHGEGTVDVGEITDLGEPLPGEGEKE